ncbi:DEAD/DEAH box helicase [Candidatus Nitrososphaera evergladensis]|uniref:DEAD/DEAH box helicase n=1 Tax=Candidatus Nitrososphaera evergladensis TaxID=1459637 RepID=UPI001D04B135|nr:DEAD/DEAH box helicase [Candidatus Nitrososphaera evergladensis]
MLPAIASLQFPFELKRDQTEAAEAWMQNGRRGSVIFSTGTGKTEIAWECARQAAIQSGKKRYAILFIVPRIVLISQNVRRLLSYGIDEGAIGTYYGERKDASREITISTYQSVINNFDLVRQADMVVLDEVHLVSETAVEFDRIFDVIVEDPGKAILGLTATIDERDPRYGTILVVAPPVKKYMIKDAVSDGRLARPVVKEVEVKFTDEEQKIYDEATGAIKEISRKLQVYDPARMTKVLMRGGARASLAKQWFAMVRKRKELLSSTKQKLYATVDIVKQHPKERIMIFSETVDSIQQLRDMLESSGIPARTIHNGVPRYEREEILGSWGKDYYPLLSVHTLEIGYDVPQVGIAIILASAANANRVAQRIGRVVRKAEGKDHALVYVVHVRDTKDKNIVKMVNAAIEKSSLSEESRSARTPRDSGKRPARGQRTIL